MDVALVLTVAKWLFGVAALVYLAAAIAGWIMWGKRRDAE